MRTNEFTADSGEALGYLAGVFDGGGLLKNCASLQPCLVFACLFSCSLTVACGGGRFNDPAGIGAMSIAPSQNPLVAQYTITTALGCPGQIMVEFGPDTSYGRTTAWYPATATSQTSTILVAGMKASTTYHMRAQAQAQCAGGSTTFSSGDQIFTTGAIPTADLLPQFVSSRPASAPNSPAPGVELYSLVSSLPNYLEPVATDLQGNVIWYCPVGGIPVKPLPNGHFVSNAGSDWYEIDLACNIFRDVSTAQVSQTLQAQGYTYGKLNAFHHDMLALPNGHWILLANIYKAFTDLPGYPGTTNVLGDVLLDIDPQGNVAWTWNSFDHLDVNRHLQGLPDWTHSNCLVFLEDGNLLLSMRHQSWILKIDYENGAGTGDILWKLGEGGDFTLMGGDPSDWFYAQHYPNVLSTNGSTMTLAVFDNGNLRLNSALVPCDQNPAAPTCYTRATMFQVDESTNVATLMWQYLPNTFSFWGGSIGTLSNGDVEFDMSDPYNTAASLVTEVTNTDNPQIVWQMNIIGVAAYRGYRLPSLYPGVTWQK